MPQAGAQLHSALEAFGDKPKGRNTVEDRPEKKKHSKEKYAQQLRKYWANL